MFPQVRSCSVVCPVYRPLTQFCCLSSWAVSVSYNVGRIVKEATGNNILLCRICEGKHSFTGNMSIHTSCLSLVARIVMPKLSPLSLASDTLPDKLILQTSFWGDNIRRP
jgi:hypothetical protein